MDKNAKPFVYYHAAGSHKGHITKRSDDPPRVFNSEDENQDD